MKNYRENLVYLSFINDHFDINDKYFMNLKKLLNDKNKFNEELQNFFDKKIRRQPDYYLIENYISKLERMQNEGIQIISIFSNNYPKALKSIKNPPIIFYKKGSLKDFDNCIAIAGSRTLSHHGHKLIRTIAYDLAKKGFTIVSGLARGTDTEAHLGALDANGKTIAVLPGPISEIYPPENEILAQDICRRGALISEKTGIAKLAKPHFVYRNRIISGISKCLILSESNGKGGTFHQFDIAKSQKRPVFIIKPEKTNSFAMKGFRKFIKRGAITIDSAEDVINFLKEKNFEKLEEKSDLLSNVTKKNLFDYHS